MVAQINAWQQPQEYLSCFVPQHIRLETLRHFAPDASRHNPQRDPFLQLVESYSMSWSACSAADSQPVSLPLPHHIVFGASQTG